MLFLAYKWRKNALSEPLHHHPGEPSRPPSGNPLCLFLASSFSQASFLLQPVSEWTVILPPHRERLLTGRSVQARMRSSDAPAACRLPFLQAVLGEKRLHVFSWKPPGEDLFREAKKSDELGLLSARVIRFFRNELSAGRERMSLGKIARRRVCGDGIR